MKKTKRIMRADNPISREGRYLLVSIFVLVLGTFIGMAFIANAQEVQGRMLDQHMQATDVQRKTLPATEAIKTELLDTFEATYYCAGFGEGCPVCGTDGITATGTKCSPLGNDWVTIAVDPRIIPYGTKLKIEMGDTIIYGIAEDTGGFADGLYPVKQIDICTANHEEAINLGTGVAIVYVIEE